MDYRLSYWAKLKSTDLVNRACTDVFIVKVYQACYYYYRLRCSPLLSLLQLVARVKRSNAVDWSNLKMNDSALSDTPRLY